MSSQSKYHDVKAGAGRVDITPEAGCLLSGFGARDHGSEGIHDELSVTALALEQDGNRSLILAFDLIGLGYDHMDRIYSDIDSHCGVKAHRILANCSHTHAGPVVLPRLYGPGDPMDYPIEPDEQYIEYLHESIIRATDDAFNSIKPCTVSWGIGETRIGLNRRAPDPSIYKKGPSGYLGIQANYPNPGKAIDRTCPVFQFSENDGKPFAIIFGASCHPTTMGADNYFISAEYPGVARNEIEKEFGEGVLSLFLQGIGGDVKPVQVAEETRFRSGSFDDVEVVGKTLASDVLSVIESGLEPLDARIRGAVVRAPVAIAEGWDENRYRRIMDSPEEPEYRKIWAQYWIRRISQGDTIPRSVPLPLSILELGTGLRFVGLGGELVTDLGFTVKNHFSNGITLPLGYTNGTVAYLPDSRVIKEGGYEVTESIYFSSVMPGPWDVSIDETVLKGFDELVKELV